MRHRGKVFLALLLGVAVLAAFTLAYAATKAPDKDVTIESKDVFKEPKKSPVVFSHTKHKEAKCTDCHHEFKDGKNVWQEGQEVKKCAACHKLEAEGKVLKLEKAYHDKCQNCHKALKKEKKKTGPTACTKCHPAKPGEKEEKEESK
ncbi:MAG: cytochrome c3 family protein [Desulfomonile tiedjei]|nr:cytochrome c3 family protein [Desulfomonile tiedjei]